MPTTVFLYPYAVSKSIELRVLDAFDPAQENMDFTQWFARTEEREGAQVTVDLSRDGIPTWNSLSLKLEASLPTSEFARVLPPTSNPKEDARLIVSVQCAATKLRQAAVLDHWSEGRWRGEIVLRRMDVRDAVHLRPRLVRGTD